MEAKVVLEAIGEEKLRRSESEITLFKEDLSEFEIQHPAMKKTRVNQESRRKSNRMGVSLICLLGRSQRKFCIEQSI